MERSANAEAVGHFTRGLELLNSLPDSDQRRERELDLQLALGTTLLMTEGHISARVEHAYSRARDLCQQIGDSPELFTAMVGLWRFYLSQARFQQALDLGRQGVEIAERMQDDAMRGEAQLMVGSSIFYLGQPAQALAHLQESRLGYERTRSPSDAFLRATDPVVMCLSWESWLLWKLGYPNQALSRSEEAIDLADRIGHPYGRGFALFFSAVLHHRRREAIRAENRARAAIELSEERGFTRWLAGGQIILGWALAEQGKHAEGLELVRTGLDAWRNQAKQGLPHLQAILAEVHMKIGEYEEALRLLENCMSLVAQTDEHRYEAELCRLIGETLLALSKERPEFKNRESEVEQHFLKAVQIAQEQEAKCFELRAAVSLGRLWQQKGKRDEAHDLLAPVYNWFTEGFDTPDLKDAKTLLESLS
jgi:predicted ATPase